MEQVASWVDVATDALASAEDAPSKLLLNTLKQSAAQLMVELDKLEGPPDIDSDSDSSSDSDDSVDSDDADA